MITDQLNALKALVGILFEETATRIETGEDYDAIELELNIRKLQEMLLGIKELNTDRFLNEAKVNRGNEYDGLKLIYTNRKSYNYSHISSWNLIKSGIQSLKKQQSILENALKENLKLKNSDPELTPHVEISEMAYFKKPYSRRAI